jgi:hypothetical protein
MLHRQRVCHLSACQRGNAALHHVPISLSGSLLTSSSSRGAALLVLSLSCCLGGRPRFRGAGCGMRGVGGRGGRRAGDEDGRVRPVCSSSTYASPSSLLSLTESTRRRLRAAALGPRRSGDTSVSAGPDAAADADADARELESRGARDEMLTSTACDVGFPRDAGAGGAETRGLTFLACTHVSISRASSVCGAC